LVVESIPLDGPRVAHRASRIVETHALVR
jgi:hypothetical protein